MNKLASILALLMVSAIAAGGQELEYKRRVVFEEVAATSCQWCPRGIVGMERLKEKYPDTFIGIVVHTAKDPMMVDAYLWPLADEFITTYPVAVVNRKKGKVIDPYVEGETLYQQEVAIEPVNALAISATYESEDKKSLEVSLRTKFNFPATLANYKYAIVVTEKDVKGSSSGYDQVNAYAGGDLEMGGFELLPNPVPASQMTYQDVARGIFPEFKGTATNLPFAFEADEVLSVNYAFELPGNILNKEHIEVIALILDGTTGEIVNAAKVSASEINPVGKEATPETAPNVILYTNSNNIIVEINSLDTNEALAEVFTLNGKKISQKKIHTPGQHILPLRATSSIYIVKITNGKDSVVRKVKL